MPTALMIAGPPTSGRLWTDVERRLRELQSAPGAAPLGCEVCELLATDSDAGALSQEGEGEGEGIIAACVGRVVARLLAVGPRPILVAHGLALPVAIRAATQVPGVRLVVSNGPVSGLDPITALIAGLARAPLAVEALRPGPVLSWLASSAGLRRAVRNPYVMDRDTVVAICGPLFATNTRRQAVLGYLSALPQAVRSTPTFDGPALACWGDEDRLYPAAVVDEARLVLPALVHQSVAGGRFLHPVERPWALADGIAAWARRT
ncbi:MAG: hypothetical protein GXP62_21450 [Oligoflexia bacterium]|nr:hypothetical protein [Oligoflexia bacterium]